MTAAVALPPICCPEGLVRTAHAEADGNVYIPTGSTGWLRAQVAVHVQLRQRQCYMMIEIV